MDVGDTKVFSSPNYPSDYDDDVDCTKTIVVSKTITDNYFGNNVGIINIKLVILFITRKIMSSFNNK